MTARMSRAEAERLARSGAVSRPRGRLQSLFERMLRWLRSHG